MIKPHRGMTMIETVVSLAILAFLTLGVARLMVAKTTEVDNVSKQSQMVAADAYLSDIFQDFHNSQSYEVHGETGEPQSIIFVQHDGSSVIYSYSPVTQQVYKEGVSQFSATKFSAIGTPGHLVVEIKIPGEKLLALDIYK